jgi:hypothetical protein
LTVNINAILSGASVISVLAVFVWLVLSGRLVPASQLDDVREDRDRALARADAETARWKQAYEFSEAARRVDAQHTGQLLEFGHATNSVLTALPAALKGDPDASAVEA